MSDRFTTAIVRRCHTRSSMPARPINHWRRLHKFSSSCPDDMSEAYGMAVRGNIECSPPSSPHAMSPIRSRSSPKSTNAPRKPSLHSHRRTQTIGRNEQNHAGKEARKVPTVSKQSTPSRSRKSWSPRSRARRSTSPSQRRSIDRSLSPEPKVRVQEIVVGFGLESCVA